MKSEERLLRRLLEIQENERRLVAHDIHDGFVQYAVGAHLQVQGIRGGLDADTIETKVEYVASLLQKAIEEGRRLIRDLRPMVLDESGVVEAIKHLIADEAKHAGFFVAFRHEVQFDRLEPRLEGAIFRIVQEALTNVKHHARTDHAAVELTQRNGALEVVVRDNGVGFDPSKVSPERFGLRGIRERRGCLAATPESRARQAKGRSFCAVALAIGELSLKTVWSAPLDLSGCPYSSG